MNHFLPVRFSNSIIAPCVPDIVQYDINELLKVTGFCIGPFFGAQASKNDIIAIANDTSIYGTGAAIYATEHPVTGQITINDHLVCWI
jgi:hypothetical protein